MAAEPPSSPSRSQSAEPTSVKPPSYDWLRWAIRITGIILMFGGTIYLALIASHLLTGDKSESGLLPVIVSLVILGLGIYVLRIGLDMLRSINAQTISSFSLVFSLIYTWILAQILPFSGWFGDYPYIIYLLMFLYFGLSYWLLKRILLHLLLPANER